MFLFLCSSGPPAVPYFPNSLAILHLSPSIFCPHPSCNLLRVESTMTAPKASHSGAQGRQRDAFFLLSVVCAKLFPGIFDFIVICYIFIPIISNQSSLSLHWGPVDNTVFFVVRLAKVFGSPMDAFFEPPGPHLAPGTDWNAIFEIFFKQDLDRSQT